MPLAVGLVGLPYAGKTTLFNVLTHAGAAITHGGDRSHVGVAHIADARLEEVARVIGSAKSSPATIRVVDAGGTSPAALGELRQVDALVAVLDAFSPAAGAARDRETLELELLVADRDHVERRLERVRRQAKSGEAALRREVDELERVLVELEGGRPLRQYSGDLPDELEPLTTKPLIVVENGPGGIDAKLEAELAELPPEEAAEFREGPSAVEQVLRRVFDELDVIAFFTANESEARAWTLRRGRTALDAAASIHSDIARGFIRCEVVRWNDLVAAGSRAEAARRGLVRLEGKGYVVEDGDVLQIRFNV